MVSGKRIVYILALLIVPVLLGSCGEKRVERPTAPAEETTVPIEVTAVPEEITLVPEEENFQANGLDAVPATEDISVPTEATAGPVDEAQAATEPVSDAAASENPIPQKLEDPRDADFVLVTDYLPDVKVELRYAGTDNFTGQTIYSFREAYLRYGTVKKLEQVCRELEAQGLYLKIWDAFRPEAAQYTLWDVCPDSRYVANPQRGHSAHTWGNTVDVTLVDKLGREVEMPTGFDDFTAAADRDYSDCTEEARKNAVLLETVMEKNGFSSYWGEWWHFSDLTKYEVETVFDPGEFSWWYADCNEYITLRSKADARSEPVNQIIAGERLLVLGFTGQFAMAEYLGQRGYVLYKYIQPIK